MCVSLCLGNIDVFSKTGENEVNLTWFLRCEDRICSEDIHPNPTKKNTRKLNMEKWPRTFLMEIVVLMF